jgi:hypothetical protein
MRGGGADAQDHRIRKEGSSLQWLMSVSGSLFGLSSSGRGLKTCGRIGRETLEESLDVVRVTGTSRHQTDQLP